MTTDDLVRDLRALGVSPGMGVIVHPSLKSLGEVEGGPDAVIAALQEVLTPAGTLLMPSFNHGFIYEEGEDVAYDPRTTPTVNGAIPDRFWRMDGVLRSLHPTHPFAAWGRHAARYVEGHHRTLALGPDSPVGRLRRDGGFALFLGVDYRANTFHHAVETALGAPCLGNRTEEHPMRLPDGRTVRARTWSYRERPCPIDDGNGYAAEMRASGAERRGPAGCAEAILLPLEAAERVIAGLLRSGKGSAPPCSRCPIRPRRNAWTVESDWDPAAQRPLPSSQAWSY